MSENLNENPNTILTDTTQTTDTTSTETQTETSEKVVPEKYEFTLPEGVELDSEILAEFEPLAKEFGLTKEQAQKLVDLQLKYSNKINGAQEDTWNTTVEQWRTDATNDKEFGGQRMDENLAMARDVLKKYGTPELTAALNVFGFGNHPELIRLLYRVAKATKEDNTVVSGGNPDKGRSFAQTIYSNSDLR